MRRHSAQLTHDHAVLPWLGANFWSRTGGPLMWRDYDPKTVREELAVLREHGLTMTRSFFYWPDFHPEPSRIDEELCDRFRDFLDAHTEAGMGTVPTFIVGHMSGENWDPVWRGGRDLYEDVWLVGRQAWFVSQMTRRFKDHPAVTGWLITNEMPGYGRIYQENPPSSDVVTAWAQFMCDAVRAAGGTQPVSLGDGAWGIEVTGRDNGFSLRDTAEYVDFVGPHVYRSDTDRPRQHYRAAFECELAAVTGQPVVLEEFGLSTDTVSAANSRHLLPPDPAQLPARRRHRLDRLEQHRLRRPVGPLALRPPPLRDALRHHRQRRTPQGAAAGTRQASPKCWNASTSPTAAAPTPTPPWSSPPSSNAATPTAAPPTAR